METDKLTDLEMAEYYKARLKAKTGYLVVLSVLMFVLGFVAARFFYLMP